MTLKEIYLIISLASKYSYLNLAIAHYVFAHGSTDNGKTAERGVDWPSKVVYVTEPAESRLKIDATIEAGPRYFSGIYDSRFLCRA